MSLKKIITALTLSTLSLLSNATSTQKFDEYAENKLIPSVIQELAKVFSYNELSIIFFYKEDIETSFIKKSDLPSTGIPLDANGLPFRNTTSYYLQKSDQCLIQIYGDSFESDKNKLLSFEEQKTNLSIVIWHEIGHCFDAFINKNAKTDEISILRREILADSYSYLMNKQLNSFNYEKLFLKLKQNREHSAIYKSNYNHYTNPIKYWEDKGIQLEIGKYESPFNSFIYIDRFIEENEPNMYTSLALWKSILDYKVDNKIAFSDFDKLLFDKLKDAPKKQFVPEFN